MHHRRRPLALLLGIPLIAFTLTAGGSASADVELTTVSMPASTIPDGVLIGAGTRVDNLGLFNLNIASGSGLSSNAAALAAFQRAANQWSAFLADPITVNINADLSNLGSSSIIGQTNSSLVQGSYSTIRNAMVADAAAGGDLGDAIVAALPTAAQFSAILPTGVSLSGNVVLTTANAKALGFNVGNGTDATITFNSQFAFDYDNRDGVGAGLVDFETVAAHEIGHALGFISAVDDVDYLLATGQRGAIGLNPLDLFRFQNNVTGRDPGSVSDFTLFPRYLATGGDAITDTLADELRMSTGAYTGDGNQASHWKDDVYTGTAAIGIMDPTYGGVFRVNANDLRALSLIGYNFVAVPEPASVVLIGMGLAGVLGAGRARRGPRTRHAGVAC